jgi:hypothetical protein
MRKRRAETGRWWEDDGIRCDDPIVQMYDACSAALSPFYTLPDSFLANRRTCRRSSREKPLASRRETGSGGDDEIRMLAMVRRGLRGESNVRPWDSGRKEEDGGGRRRLMQVWVSESGRRHCRLGGPAALWYGKAGRRRDWRRDRVRAGFARDCRKAQSAKLDRVK